MKLTIQKAAALLLLFILNSQLCIVRAQGTAFTYQGRLNDGSNPASGNYDLRFTIYDSTNSSGNVIAGPITNAATAVGNGLFTVTLDFGAGVFTGPARWLQIDVRTNGGGDFISLLPRQPLTATPYALLAGTVVPGGIPAGVYTNAIIFSNAGNQFFGNGGGLTNLNASTFTSGTLPLAQLPEAVVTNGQTTGFGLGATNLGLFVTTYFDVSNCAAFPFLNGHWVYDWGDGYFTNTAHPKTNFFYADNSSYSTWVFANRIYTTNFPDNGVFISTPNVSNPSPIPFNSPNYWTLNDWITPDPIYLTNNNTINGWTNLLAIPAGNSQNMLGGVRIVNGNGGNYPAFQIFDANSNLMFDVQLEGNSGYFNNGKLTTYATTFGMPWTNGQSGFQTFRYNGAVYYPTMSSDTRGQAEVGFVFGNLAQYGGNMERLVRRDLTYSQGNVTLGSFCRSIVQDPHGGVQLGDTSMANHGYDDIAPAWTEIWGCSTDKPALLITSWGNNKMYTGTPTNGAVQCDGTNIWITTSGVTSVPLISSSASPYNGSGLTNLNASGLTGSLPTATLPGITTNVSNGGITFYITNGLIMRVSSP